MGMGMMNPYAYGTMALLMTVGNYYHMHDQYIYNKEMSIKKIDDERLAQQKLKDDIASVRKNFRFVCYYFLEHKPGRLKVEDVFGHCSHLIVGYAIIDPDTLTLTTRRLEDWEVLKKAVALKEKHPDMKVMLSVADGPGGPMSKMVTSWFLRYRFLYSLLDILDELAFDGIDFDWEFPGFYGGFYTDKKYFAIFLKELKVLFKEKEKPFLISAAVAGLPPLIKKCYDIPALAKTLDFVNVMTYDYFYYRDQRPFTAHHSPLFARPYIKKGDTDSNVLWTVDYWTLQGMPKWKMNIGISTYGRTYTLKDPHLHEIDTPAEGPGKGKGLLPYGEVCNFLRDGAKSYLDGYGQVPFAFKGKDWVSYEDPFSVTIKAVWSREVGCGGVMTFSLNTDDYAANCDGKTKFPIHRAIWRALKKGW